MSRTCLFALLMSISLCVLGLRIAFCDCFGFDGRYVQLWLTGPLRIPCRFQFPPRRCAEQPQQPTEKRRLRPLLSAGSRLRNARSEYLFPEPERKRPPSGLSFRCRSAPSGRPTPPFPAVQGAKKDNSGNSSMSRAGQTARPPTALPPGRNMFRRPVYRASACTSIHLP